MMLKKMRSVVLVGWAVVSVAILAQFLYDAYFRSNVEPGVYTELEIRLLWSTMIINFPLSYIGAFVGGLFWKFFDGPIVEWCFMTFAGFVQWFILFPYLVSSLRSR